MRPAGWRGWLALKIIEKIFTVPTQIKEEPPWAGQVERWFQLDADGMAICMALEKWLAIEGVHRFPDMIVQASLSGSHVADLDFVNSGADSPAKFVYTLPSIAVGVMAQFLSWKGFSFNFTGAQSWELAEQFVQGWMGSSSGDKGKVVWVFSVRESSISELQRLIRFKQVEAL